MSHGGHERPVRKPNMSFIIPPPPKMQPAYDVNPAPPPPRPYHGVQKSGRPSTYREFVAEQVAVAEMIDEKFNPTLWQRIKRWFGAGS